MISGGKGLLRRVFHVAALGGLVALLAISLIGQFSARPEGSRGNALKLPAGLQVYRIAQAADAWPRLTEARIDPLDVHVGFRQTIEVAVESRAGDANVVARIQTDNKVVDLPLDPVTGSETETAPGVVRRLHRGSWVVHDTRDRTYQTRIEATAGEDRSEVVMAWTDACGIPPGGDFTLSSPCTISSADGVDNGSLTLSSSLTLNASFAFNAGKSVTITGSGSLAMCEGCSLLKTNVYQVDADGDGYPANGIMYLQDVAPPRTGVRRYLLQSTVDCDDAQYSTTNTCSIPTCWNDADRDGYYSSTAATACDKDSSDIPGDDCYDDNDNAHPGQTQGFTADRGDGSFDYNCDGTEEKIPQLVPHNYCGAFGACVSQTIPKNEAACGGTLQAQYCQNPGPGTCSTYTAAYTTLPCR